LFGHPWRSAGGWTGDVPVEGDGVENVGAEGVSFENAVTSIKFKGCPEVPTLLASEIPVVPYSWFVVDEDGSTDGTKGVCVVRER